MESDGCYEIYQAFLRNISKPQDVRNSKTAPSSSSSLLTTKGVSRDRVSERNVSKAVAKSQKLNQSCVSVPKSYK